MNNPVTAMNPAALRELGTQLERAASGIPQHRADAGSVADPAADGAFQDFTGGWAAYLRGLTEVVQRSAQQARLTALAFELLDRR